MDMGGIKICEHCGGHDFHIILTNRESKEDNITYFAQDVYCSKCGAYQTTYWGQTEQVSKSKGA